MSPSPSYLSTDLPACLFHVARPASCPPLVAQLAARPPPARRPAGGAFVLHLLLLLMVQLLRAPSAVLVGRICKYCIMAYCARNAPGLLKCRLHATVRTSSQSETLD
eukprot:COSAG01_NODE_10570_length_2130_cov_4.813392_3_plen_107_part_00